MRKDLHLRSFPASLFRYDGDAVEREDKLKKQVARYVPVKLTAEVNP